MSKRYKVWMFVLAGIGALMLIGGVGSVGENVGQGIFGIIAGLIVGLPMLLLYKPLSEKKNAEAEEKAKAAEREKQRKIKEWMENHETLNVTLDTVSQAKAAIAEKKEKSGTIEYVTLKRYYKNDALRLALIIDNEKIGDIITDAEEVSEKWHKAEKAEFEPSFVHVLNETTGEMEISVGIDITFTYAA